MDGSLTFGRWLFALAMVLFGVEFFIFLTSMTGPIPGPPWTHTTLFLDWLACIGFILAGVSIATGKMARLGSLLLGGVLLLYAVFRYGHALVTRLHDPGVWTVVFEILAMSGGAWVLAASFPAEGRGSRSWDGVVAGVGRFLIAISLVVFAVQHYLYASYVASLVPGWIPGHVFWAYFAGVAFVAAALAIVTKKMVRLAGTLLGTMFLLWVLLLHAPRVTGSLRNSDEATSLLVALAMSGVGFALAGESGDGVGGLDHGH